MYLEGIGCINGTVQDLLLFKGVKMAHFAQLDKNNFVINVIVVNNETLNNLPFPESEPIGIEFCKSLYGQDTNWKQTSYNNNFRGIFAGVGYKYEAYVDEFVDPNATTELGEDVTRV